MLQGIASELGRLDVSTYVNGWGLSQIAPFVLGLNSCFDKIRVFTLLHLSRLHDTLQIDAKSLWLLLNCSDHIKAILLAHLDFSVPLVPFLQVKDIVAVITWDQERLGGTARMRLFGSGHSGVVAGCTTIIQQVSDNLFFFAASGTLN